MQAADEIALGQKKNKRMKQGAAVCVDMPKCGGLLKIMRAAGKADEPDEASLVHNTMLKAFWSQIDIQ